MNKDKVRVFGNSAVDISGLIKNATDVDAIFFSSSDHFVCTACYEKLIRFEKISSNLNALHLTRVHCSTRVYFVMNYTKMSRHLVAWIPARKV